MNISITLVGTRGKFSPNIAYPGGARVPHPMRVAITTATDILCATLNNLSADELAGSVAASQGGLTEAPPVTAAQAAPAPSSLRTVEKIGPPAQVVVEDGRARIVDAKPGNTGFGVTSPGSAPAPPPLTHVPSVGMLNPNPVPKSAAVSRGGKPAAKPAAPEVAPETKAGDSGEPAPKEPSGTDGSEAQ